MIREMDFQLKGDGVSMLSLLTHARLDYERHLYRPDLEIANAQTIPELRKAVLGLVEVLGCHGGANELDLLVNPNLVGSQPYYSAALLQCGKILGKSDPSIADFYRVVYGLNSPLLNSF